MTAGEYEAALKNLGLTPYQPSYEGATIYQDRDKQFHTIPNAAELTERERADFIALLRARLGV